MLKKSTLCLSLCLSSLTVALVAGTSMKTSATPDQIIAQNHLYTANKGNVGGPLAKQLQGKPVVVDIYATWCGACKNIAPTLSQLKQDYAGKANFVVLDVSDKSKANEAESKARQLGLGQFFAANKAKTGMVAIINPGTGEILAQHYNNANKSAYTSVLNANLPR
ncbi:TlpA family protein disulfide reductase [Crocosphaera sp. XPORK-15E]|uniref:TlpA family protein disulfide reductase n=1 Tax=Crocosphaera sp. XPORK-15E TaxID=3110247 RepID=UPI002B1FD06F|nr:thioredoxin domain-containing protein [Crocosphaera sp. XPORK-15E]MEA5535506.1 thioredoxin domain-containing protein [Crocosphaera sp. XPORK-15E]